MKKRSQAAGCDLEGILVSDSGVFWKCRGKYFWSGRELRRRGELKVMEQRLRNLDAAGE